MLTLQRMWQLFSLLNAHTVWIIKERKLIVPCLFHCRYLDRLARHLLLNLVMHTPDKFSL